MTDLERARRMLREWGDEADTVIADELAAARREGAEEMRERAAQTVLAGSRGGIRGEIAAAIRALPLTPEEPT